MIKLVQPQIKELKYRKKLLKDPQTMAFNKSNGGTVDFNEKIWQPWYALWMNDAKYYYAYIYDDTLKNILEKFLTILKKNIVSMFLILLLKLNIVI